MSDVVRLLEYRWNDAIYNPTDVFVKMIVFPRKLIEHIGKIGSSGPVELLLNKLGHLQHCISMLTSTKHQSRPL